jgi:hypothetical protein
MIVSKDNRGPYSHGRDLDSRRRKERWRRGEEVLPTEVEATLQRLLSGTPLGGRIALSAPATRSALEKAWGEHLVRRCEFTGLADGVLSVRVREAAWRFELGFRKTELLASLRREAPQLEISALKLLS